MARGRPVAIRRSVPLEVALDEELRARLDIRLWSEAEQRVPKGAYKAYFDGLVSRDLATATLDLAPFAGTLPGTALLRGTPEAVQTLETLLKGSSHEP